MINQITQSEWGDKTNLESVVTLPLTWSEIENQFGIKFETPTIGELRDYHKDTKLAYIELSQIMYMLIENTKIMDSGVTAIIKSSESRAEEALDIILSTFSVNREDCKYIHDFYKRKDKWPLLAESRNKLNH